MTDNELLLKIGAKLKELRLAKNIKQKEVVEKSGLSAFSVSQMETGHNTSLLSLLAYLRAIDRLDMMEPFMRGREIDEAVWEEFLVQKYPMRKRATTSEAPKPYFNDDEDGDLPLRMVADDGE